MMMIHVIAVLKKITHNFIQKNKTTPIRALIRKKEWHLKLKPVFIYGSIGSYNIDKSPREQMYH